MFARTWKALLRPEADTTLATAPAASSEERGPIDPGPAARQGGDGREETARRRLTIDMVESDLLRAVGMVEKAAAAARGAGEAVVRSMADVGAGTRQMAASAQGASNDLSTLATTSDEVSSAAEHLAEMMSAAQNGTVSATNRAEALTRTFDDLGRSAEHIGTILDTISGIARQTNLLALNATIEAARAGEAGRGFAVVAQEVKSLSAASEAAANEIRRSIAALRNSVRSTREEATAMVNDIADVSPLFAEAAGAVTQQRAAVAELARRINQAARYIDSVSVDSLRIEQNTANANVECAAAHQAIEEANRNAADLRRRFVTVVRQTDLGDRRMAERLPTEIAVTLEARGQTFRSNTIDLSTGGILMAPVAALRLAQDDRLTLTLGGLPATAARVVGVSELGVHIAFEQQTQAFAEAVEKRFHALEDEARPLIRRAQEMAGRFARLMEADIDSGRTTLGTFFDTEYRPIPGSSPQQFTTAALPRLEELFREPQETLLASDPSMIFCCAVDRNGYLPVHNLVYSKPQRPSEPDWNAANSRNRRIFDDRAGLTCARSTRPYMVYVYKRDMGAGQVVFLKEFVAPITVKGRHWGGFRSAYRF
jgi:methyl-accepting chemotaxis protein